MAALEEYIRRRAGTDASIEELEARLEDVKSDLARQTAVTEYNVMMGILEDPEEEDEENE